MDEILLKECFGEGFPNVTKISAQRDRNVDNYANHKKPKTIDFVEYG